MDIVGRVKNFQTDDENVKELLSDLIKHFESASKPTGIIWWKTSSDNPFMNSPAKVDSEWAEYVKNSPNLSYKYIYESPQNSELTNAYKEGFLSAAEWSHRDDLYSDIDSPAYLEEMRDRLNL